MTATILALLSILVGIIGANMAGLIAKKKSFGLTGNSIAGVFGSILLIKTIGRFGFDPLAILETGSLNYLKMALNFLVSFMGGGLFLYFVYYLKRKLL